MKLLFDENLSPRLPGLVQDLFPGSTHVREHGLDQSSDRTIFDFASNNNFTLGGWCPKGRRSEDGVIPPQYELVETTGRSYIDRTRRNVVDSDATVVFTKGRPTGGSRATIETALAEKRPVLSIDVSRWPQEKGADIEVFLAWLAEHGVGTLNVAGSRESKTPGLHAAVRQFLLEALAPAMDEALPLAAESPTEWGKP